MAVSAVISFSMAWARDEEPRCMSFSYLLFFHLPLFRGSVKLFFSLFIEFFFLINMLYAFQQVGNKKGLVIKSDAPFLRDSTARPALPLAVIIT